MLRYCVCVVLGFCSLAVCAQEADTLNKQQHRIADLDQKFTTALLQSDTLALNQLLSDDYTISHTNGRMQTKAQFIRALSSGNVRFTQMDVVEEHIRAYREAAIVTGVTKNKVVVRGKEGEGAQVRFTRTYCKVGGKWKIVAEQGSIIQ